MVSSSPLVRNVSLPARSQQQQLPSSSQEEEEEQGRAQQRNNNDDENTQKKRTTLERAKSVDASKGLGVALDELSLSPSSLSTPTSPRASIRPLAPPPRSKARPAPTSTPTPSVPITPSTEESASFPPTESETTGASSSSSSSSSFPSLASPPPKSIKGPPSPILVSSASSSGESMSNDSGVFLVKAAEDDEKVELEVDDPLNHVPTPAWTVPSLPSPSNTVYSTPTTPSAVSSPSTWKFPTASAAPVTPPSPAVSHFTPLSPDLNPVGPLPKRRASSGIYTPASFPGPAGRNSSAPSARDQELAAQATRSSVGYGARRKSSGLGLGFGLGLGIGVHAGEAGGGPTSPGGSTTPEGRAGAGGSTSNASSPTLPAGFLARGRSYFGGTPSASLLGSFGSSSPSPATSPTTNAPGSISPTGVYTPKTFALETRRYTPLTPTSLDGSLPYPFLHIEPSAYTANHNHQNLHIHLPLSSRTSQSPLSPSGALLASPPLPVVARKASSTPVKRKPVPSSTSVSMYRSHSDESNGSSVEEEQEKSLKTPSPERPAFLQGREGGGGGGKGMRTLEVDEHVGLGAEVGGRVW